MMDQTKGLLLTTLGALAVVPDSLFVRLIEADAMVIVFWRAFLTGLIITIGTFVLQGRTPIRAVLTAGPWAYFYMVAVAISGILFVLAVSMTSVANVVFIIASMPVFAAIYSWVFLGERISARTVFTILIVGFGLGVIAYGSSENEHATLAGDGVALLVAACFAAALTAARKVRHVSMVPAVGVAYLIAAVVLSAFISPWKIAVDQWYLFVIHALFISASACFLALGPRYITSAEVALLILLESVLAPLLVWVLLGENPGIYALIGGAIVTGALAISNVVALLRRNSKTLRIRPEGSAP